MDRDFDVDDPANGWRCIFEHEEPFTHPPGLLPPPKWRRLSDVHDPADITLFRGAFAEPGDIVQGNLQTCFFLGALGSMAYGQKGWVRQLFVAHDAAAGIYGLRFFHRGRWQAVCVDDRIGFYQGERPWFSHNSVAGTVWVSIIEKAFAKLNGNYEALNRGHAREAMVALTGGVMAERLYLHSNTEAAADEVEAGPTSGVTARGASQVFHCLQSALQRGMVLSCEVAVPPGCAVESAASASRPGLFVGHLYSILGCVTTETGNNLIKIRNPWGHSEWQGAWGDYNTTSSDYSGSAEWFEHDVAESTIVELPSCGADGKGCRQQRSELAASLGHVFSNDGTFYMDAVDFCRVWSHVDACRLFPSTWSMSHLRSTWRAKTQRTIESEADWAWMAEDTVLSSSERVELMGVERATEAVLVLQQHESNLGLISFCVCRCEEGLPVLAGNGMDIDDSLSARGSSTSWMCEEHDAVVKSSECESGGGSGAQLELVCSSAWTWRRGALVEDLVLEPGYRYFVEAVGFNDADEPAHPLEGTQLLLRLYAPCTSVVMQLRP